MRIFICVTGIVFTMSGCSHLILNESDSPATQSAKIAARVPLGLVTLGLSEVRISQIKDEWACNDAGGWYFMGACRENSEANRNRAMLLMPSMIGATQQTFNRPIIVPTIPAQVTVPVQPTRAVSCTTQTVGTQLFTTCN